jgi:hypothetical protein
MKTNNITKDIQEIVNHLENNSANFKAKIGLLFETFKTTLNIDLINDLETVTKKKEELIKIESNFKDNIASPLKTSLISQNKEFNSKALQNLFEKNFKKFEFDINKTLSNYHHTIKHAVEVLNKDILEETKKLMASQEDLNKKYLNLLESQNAVVQPDGKVRKNKVQQTIEKHLSKKNKGSGGTP